MNSSDYTQTITTGVDPRNLPEFIAIREEINKASHPSQTALTMRRMLTTGESEPNAAEQPEAIAEGDRRIDALDRELTALRNEMELRKSISNNSLLTALERQGTRNQDNRLQQKAGNEDQGFSQMGQSQSSGAN